MKKLLFCVSALAVLSLGTSQAAVYKGQKEYVKKCRKCHGGGQEMANSRTMSDWKRLLSNKGTGLAKLHLGHEEAKKSWDYFGDSRYKKRAKHLSDFLEEYASDSGNVPACN